MLRIFPVQGLNSDLEAYIILREQLTEENNKDLILDEMIKALIEYETGVKDQDSEIKFLVQNAKSNKNQKNDGHIEKDCHHTHPEKRPKNWKPRKGKEHLVSDKTNEEKLTMVAMRRTTTKSMKASSKDDRWWMSSFQHHLPVLVALRKVSHGKHPTWT